MTTTTQTARKPRHLPAGLININGQIISRNDPIARHARGEWTSAERAGYAPIPARKLAR